MSERTTLLERRVPNILLSIKPEWAEAILDGEKRYEYRRVAPSKNPPFRVVLYATAPVKQAVGAAKVNQVLSGNVYELVDQTVASTPHELGDVLDYFDGRDEAHALQIEKTYRFPEPKTRQELESMGATPSQNFCYIGEVSSDFDQLEEGFREQEQG